MNEENKIPASEIPDPTVQKPKTKAGKILNIVIDVILVIAILLAAVCTYVSFVSSSGNGVPNLFGAEILSVQTDSMYPTLKAGDLIIDRVVDDPSQLQVGDIITFWTLINGERVLNTHRIVEIDDGGGFLVFLTKGDNNNMVDPMTVHESSVVGKYQSRLSGVGKVLDFLQTSTGFLIVVVIPVALFFLYQLVQFFRVLFEYQSVKNRLRFEEEQAARLAAIDAAAAALQNKAPDAAPETGAAPPEEPAAVDRAALKAELREQMKAEMMAEMLAELRKQNAAAEKNEAPAKEKNAEETPEEAPAEEKPEKEIPEEAPAEETPAEEKPAEDAPAEEKPIEPAEKASEETGD